MTAPSKTSAYKDKIAGTVKEALGKSGEGAAQKAKGQAELDASKLGKQPKVVPKSNLETAF